MHSSSNVHWANTMKNRWKKAASNEKINITTTVNIQPLIIGCWILLLFIVSVISSRILFVLCSFCKEQRTNSTNFHWLYSIWLFLSSHSRNSHAEINKTSIFISLNYCLMDEYNYSAFNNFGTCFKEESKTTETCFSS